MSRERGLESYGRRRNLLYPQHLEAFRKWIIRRGWFEEPCNPTQEYEVLRLRRHSDHLQEGERAVTIIYRREKTLKGHDRHLTVQANLVPFVEKFFDEEIRYRSEPKTNHNHPVTGRP